MLNVGYDNYVMLNKVLSITTFETAPIRRMVANAKDRGIAIDCTHGKKTNSVILLRDGFVVLSANKARTLQERYSKARCDENEG